MNFKDYYRQQSLITNPGCYAHCFDELPDDPALLCEITRNVLTHFLDVEENNISSLRLAELDLRFIDKMLAQLFKLHSAALQQTRSKETKLIGSCRDFSLLLCAMLRHKQIPARIRFGFSTFHIPGFHHDQVLLEYWDDTKKSWCLADPRINEKFIKKYKLAANTFSHNIPYEIFLTAGQAWQLCRTKKMNPHRFGTGLKNRISGWKFIRNKLIQDLAALNKMELLSWDCWGIMLDDHQEESVELLDYIASLTSQSEMDIEKINEVYAHDSLKVPEMIFSDSLVSGWGNIKLSSN